MPKISLLNTPYGVLAQFASGDDGGPALDDCIDVSGVYAAGRLDRDGEGLLLLTDNGRLQHRLADPRHKPWKAYWVQVEGMVRDQAVRRLRRGILLKDRPTQPAPVRPIAGSRLWPRDPPVRCRKTVPTSWLEVVIRESRNRQVRRMTAAAGYPSLRLVHVAIGGWRLGDLPPGRWRLPAWPAGPANAGQLQRRRRQGRIRA